MTLVRIILPVVGVVADPIAERQQCDVNDYSCRREVDTARSQDYVERSRNLEIAVRNANSTNEPPVVNETTPWTLGNNEPGEWYPFKCGKDFQINFEWGKQ